MTQLLENTLLGGILILVTLALRAALRRQVTPGVWITLWGVCLVRLLTPVPLEGNLSLYNLFTLLRRESPPLPPASAVIYVGAAEQAAKAPENTLKTVVLAVYLLGAAVVAARMLVSWLSVRREIRRTRWVDCRETWYQALLHGAKLRTGEVRGAPLTFGVLRPVIVIPPRGISEADLRFVLMHEAVHARRRDNLWQYVSAVALIVHWYNPLVWLMARSLRRDLEFSCDRAVLRRLKGDRREEYAKALLRIAVRQRGPNFCSPFGTKQIQERIVMIMKFKKMTIVGLIVALLIVGTVSAVFATDAKPEEPAQPVEQADETPATEETDVQPEEAPALEMGRMYTAEELVELGIHYEPTLQNSEIYFTSRNGKIFILERTEDDPHLYVSPEYKGRAWMERVGGVLEGPEVRSMIEGEISELYE